jgi:hypothetical protein
MDDLINQFNRSFHLSINELETLIENHKRLRRLLKIASSDANFVNKLHSKNIEYSQHITFNINDPHEKILEERLDIVLNIDHLRYPFEYCQLTMDLLYSFLSFLGYEMDEDGNVV